MKNTLKKKKTNFPQYNRNTNESPTLHKEPHLKTLAIITYDSPTMQIGDLEREASAVFSGFVGVTSPSSGVAPRIFNGGPIHTLSHGKWPFCMRNVRHEREISTCIHVLDCVRPDTRIQYTK